MDIDEFVEFALDNNWKILKTLSELPRWDFPNVYLLIDNADAKSKNDTAKAALSFVEWVREKVN